MVVLLIFILSCLVFSGTWFRRRPRFHHLASIRARCAEPDARFHRRLPFHIHEGRSIAVTCWREPAQPQNEAAEKTKGASGISISQK